MCTCYLGKWSGFYYVWTSLFWGQHFSCQEEAGMKIRWQNKYASDTDLAQRRLKPAVISSSPLNLGSVLTNTDTTLPQAQQPFAASRGVVHLCSGLAMPPALARAMHSSWLQQSSPALVPPSQPSCLLQSCARLHCPCCCYWEETIYICWELTMEMPVWSSHVCRMWWGNTGSKQHTHTHTQIHTLTHTFIHTYTFTHNHTHLHIHTHNLIYIHTHLHIHTISYSYTYTLTHTSRHTHTHTHNLI